MDKLIKYAAILILFFYNISAQQFKYLSSVPESFKEKYDSLQYNFNPLHVGDVWQYYFEEYDAYFSTKVLKDSLINNKKYYKKQDWIYDTGSRESNFISWERNDTLNGNAYMLDFEDIDNDGDTLEEFLIDSLVLETGNRYKTRKYAYKGYYEEYLRTTYVYGTQWVEIWGDTVLLKQTEIEELFQQEDIADKFGIVGLIIESPFRPLVGAIINGKQYGTIVDVDQPGNELPQGFALYQNYPNPFNPVTTIKYQIPSASSPLLNLPAGRQGGQTQAGFVSLKIFNLLGQEVTTLVNKHESPGTYEVKWNASGYPSGVYFYTLFVNHKPLATNKLMLLR